MECRDGHSTPQAFRVQEKALRGRDELRETGLRDASEAAKVQAEVSWGVSAFP